MKKRVKYILILLVFIVVMGLVLSYFYYRYKSIDEVKLLLNDISSLEPGNYELKNGLLFNSNNERINNNVYLDASGTIRIDQYKNVSFKLNKNYFCISKTELGNIEYENHKCTDFKDINVNMITNNNIISFETKETLKYMVSNKDDFKGVWIKQDNDQNIIINSFNEGKNYIWFSDLDGNLSKTYTFNINCLNTTNANYDSSVFYCSGSTVLLDDIKWVVLKDNNSSIKLMKYLPLDNKMPYSENQYDFKWSNSTINKYLNNEFINNLSDKTINKLLTFEICNDYTNHSCNDEICGGREKEEIERNDYTCYEYTTSKVKLISYDDFNYAYSTSKDKTFLSGNFLSMNSFEYGKVSSIQYNYDYYILESVTNKLDIRPVIIIDK